MSLYKTLKGKTTYSSGSLYSRLKEKEKAATLGNVADFRKLDEASAKQYEVEQSKKVEAQKTAKPWYKQTGTSLLKKAVEGTKKIKEMTPEQRAKDTAAYRTKLGGQPAAYFGSRAEEGLMGYNQGLLNAIATTSKFTPLGYSSKAIQGLKEPQNIFEKEAQAGQKVNKPASKAQQIAGDVLSSTTRMAPSILASLINPALGKASFAIPAGGQYAREAELEGASDSQQMKYGMIGGAVEAAIESIAFIKPLKKILPSGLLDKVVKNGTANMLKNLLHIGIDAAKAALGEAGEEAITNPIMGLTKKAIYDKKKPWLGEDGVINLKQMGYDALIGGLTGGMFAAPNVPFNIAEAKATKQFIEQNYDATLAVAQGLPETYKSSQTAAEYTKAKYPISYTELVDLQKQTAKDLKDYATTVKSNTLSAKLKAAEPVKAAEVPEVVPEVKQAVMEPTQAAEAKAEPERVQTPLQVKAAHSGAQVVTTPKVEVPAKSGTTMTERQVSTTGKDSLIANRKVKAYMFENPEVKTLYQGTAEYILGNEFVPNEQYARTTDIMKQLKADTGLTPAQIKDALERLIENHGQENAAAAKRIELVIDDMLTNGFDTVDGVHIDPNEEYIEMKSVIEGREIVSTPKATLDDDITDIFSRQDEQRRPKAYGTEAAQEPTQKDYPSAPKQETTVAEIEAIEEEFFGHKLLKIDLQKFAEKVLSAKEKLLAEFKKEKAAIRWMAKERQTAALDRLSQKYDAKIEKLNKLLDAEKYKNFWKSELDKKDLRDRINQLRTDKNQQIADMKKKFSEKLKETKKDYTLKKQEAIGKLKEKIRDKAAEDRAKAAERAEINKKLTKLRNLDLKHMRPEYKKKIEAILSVFDITAKSHTARKIGELQKLKQYIAENPEHSIPDYMLNQLDMLSKKTVSQITKEEFDNIYDAVMHLAHLEKLKNKLIMKERYRNAEEIAGEASEGILENRKIRVDPTAIDTNKPEFSRNIFKEFFHQHLNPETLTMMSEQRGNGVLKKILFDDMYEGHSNEVKYKQEAYMIFESFLEGLGSDIRSWSRSFNKSLKNSDLVEIPISKQPKQTINKIRITKAERLYLYLASQDADAKRSMIRGGVSFGTNLSQVVKLTEADLKTIADSMTKEERQFAALVDKYFGDFARIRMNEVFLELNGYELIPSRKGYVPIKRHQDFLDKDYLKMRNKNNSVSLEGMGILKERVKSSTPIVADDIFRVLVEHIEKVGAYTGLAKPLRNAKMLLENPKLKNAYRQVGMYNIHGQLNKYIQDIESKSVDLEFIDKLGYSIQNKFASSALGLNPFTILKQFTAYALEANEIPAKYLLKAQFTKTVYDEIRKYSPILAERAAGNVSLELGEIGRIARIRRLFGNYKDIPQLLTKGIVAADKQIIGKTWNAAKAMIKEQNPHLTEGQVLERTARETEEIVRHTNSASTMYDRSSIARSRSLFTRAATMFTSQTNIMFNSSVRAVLEYNQSDKTAKDFGIATKKLVTILVIANVMEQAVDQLRNKIKGKEDDEDRWNIPLDILEGILNQVYFVGKAFSAYRSKIKFGKFAGYDLTISQFQVVNQIIDYATDLTALVEQVSSKERYKSGVNKGKVKWKKTLSGLTDETFSILSRLMGLPYDSVKNLIESFTKKE